MCFILIEIQKLIYKVFTKLELNRFKNKKSNEEYYAISWKCIRLTSLRAVCKGNSKNIAWLKQRLKSKRRNKIKETKKSKRNATKPAGISIIVD